MAHAQEKKSFAPESAGLEIVPCAWSIVWTKEKTDCLDKEASRPFAEPKSIVHRDYPKKGDFASAN